MSLPSRLLGRTNLNISLIGLGTVEIGLAYGIGVKNIPTEKEAEAILKSAVEMGITYIDTARDYGLAEERIGKSGITKMDGVVVGTKCGQFLKNEPDLQGEDLAKRIRKEIDTSRRLLKQEQLQLVQLHIELAEYTDFRELVAIMQKLKDEGKVQHVGIATRGEEAPLAAIKTGFFETLQTAYSILDQRMGKSVLPSAQKNNLGVINRSVLLKGALTPAAQKLPDQLAPLKNNSAKAAAIAKEAGMDLPTVALRFVISNPVISTALIGTIKPQHLETSIKAVEAGPLPDDILTELAKLAIEDPLQVDPSKWPTIT
jgi:aryl-alcohol dehydrogenase-like predicted oxidoreductase